MSTISIKLLFGEEVSLMTMKQIKRLLILNNLFKKSWSLIGVVKTQKISLILRLLMNIPAEKQMNSTIFFEDI